MHSDKPYMCPHCSKTFLTEVGMRRCINKHTNRWNDTIKYIEANKIELQTYRDKVDDITRNISKKELNKQYLNSFVYGWWCRAQKSNKN